MQLLMAVLAVMAATVGGAGWGSAGLPSVHLSPTVPGFTSGYRAPVAGRLVVLRGFTPPVTRYGAGHLGVDLTVPAGAAALAAGPGTVRFAGSVAGRGVVVLVHPDGISTEYEPIAPAVHAGQVVLGGSVLGRVTGKHRGCPASRCLHWGARRGEEYLDPLSLLRSLGVVRLLPWGWTPGSPLD